MSQPLLIPNRFHECPGDYAPSEVEAYLMHRAEIRRQFWWLVRNRPFLLFRFIRQRKQVMRQIREDLENGKYLEKGVDAHS